MQNSCLPVLLRAKTRKTSFPTFSLACHTGVGRHEPFSTESVIVFRIMQEFKLLIQTKQEDCT